MQAVHHSACGGHRHQQAKPEVGILEAFSFLNNPPMHVTRETIKMLVTCYAERLGTCVRYQPPRAFALRAVSRRERAPVREREPATGAIGGASLSR